MTNVLPWVVFVLYVGWAELRAHRQRREVRTLTARLARYGAALLLLTPGRADGFPTPRAHAYARTPQHPDNAAVEALIFLETRVPPDEWCYWRFFHWLPTAEEDLSDEVGNFRAYVQMLNGTQPGPVRPFPIDKAGRVWAVDRREAGWSAAAFSAVARLDNTCREPQVDPLLADELRRAVGVTPDGTRHPHCEGLVPGAWFVREVQETDRHRADPENIAYYNLLYSRERFGDDFETGVDVGKARERRAEREGSDPTAAPPDKAPRSEATDGGRPLPYDALVAADRVTVVDVRRRPVVILERGTSFRVTNAADGGWVYGRTPGGREGYLMEADLAAPVPARPGPAPTYEQVTGHKYKARAADGFVDRNFPRDAAEFDERWGVKAANDFLTRQKIFKSNGTIIAGYFNDPRAGSLVSDNDRVNQFANGPLGVAMKTRDFEVTAGRRNLVNDPLGVALDQVPEDASENIVQKQDDWPAWALNGPRKAGAKRVESGDPHIVHDKVNGGTLIVQTFHKCVGCHYPSDVVLAPSNEKFVAGVKRGMEIFAKRDKANALVVDRFFFDGDAVGQGWRWKLEDWRRPFARSLKLATRTPADPNGWPGTRFASVSNTRRDWYDAPVKLGQAAAELGYPRLAVMVGCLLLLDDFDAQQLFLDDPDWPGVPRAAWDADLFGRLAYVLAGARDLELGPLLAPGFVEAFPAYGRDPRVPPYTLKHQHGGK